MKNRRQNPEQELTIKLRRWQIPFLLGALRLGIWNQDWSAALVQSSIGTYDTHAAKWILRVGSIIQQVKNQTGIADEHREYATKDTLDWIANLVFKECAKNEKELARYYEEENRKENVHQKDNDETIEEKKLSYEVVSVPITDEMLEAVEEKIKKVMNEIR